MDLLSFSGKISRRSVESLLVAMQAADSPQGVFVNSPGGAFEFFSVLGPPLERMGLTMVAGDVRSAATILYLLGRRRLALPDATFFFHEVRTLVGPVGEITITDIARVLEYRDRLAAEDREGIEEWLRRMRAAQSWFLEFLAVKTQVPSSTFLSLMREGATLTAREARRYGIVHEIVEPERLGLVD